MLLASSSQHAIWILILQNGKQIVQIFNQKARILFIKQTKLYMYVRFCIEKLLY